MKMDDIGPINNNENDNDNDDNMENFDQIDLAEANSKKARLRKIIIYSVIGFLILTIIIIIILIIILVFSNNKEKKLICETGENEKCLTCDLEKDICSSCNKGYFLPEDDVSKLTC